MTASDAGSLFESSRPADNVWRAFATNSSRAFWGLDQLYTARRVLQNQIASTTMLRPCAVSGTPTDHA